jgi:dolichyl-phosphate beta-glucosyltransferase
VEPPLTIVIPAYNEERRLPQALAEVARWAAANEPRTEVIVVENGSTDGTVAVVAAAQRDWPQLRLVAGVPRGKGIAVRRGMLEARGGLRFLCDADLSMPIDQLGLFLAAAVDADVVIGTREGPGARRLGEPPLRHLMGRVFNLLVRLLLIRGFNDTQCGFKLLRAEAARDIFSRARMVGWGFDPEVLFLARRRGYRIAEVPIEWRSDPDSRVHPVRAAVAMVRELVSVRWLEARGAYDA